MKTAISLPDRLYKEAEKTAKSLGIPRSQLFAKALQEFISRHAKENVTEHLNKVYSNTTLSSNLTNTENATIESIRELIKNDTW